VEVRLILDAPLETGEGSWQSLVVVAFLIFYCIFYLKGIMIWLLFAAGSGLTAVASILVAKVLVLLPRSRIFYDTSARFYGLER
jgi:hypothetical protein